MQLSLRKLFHCGLYQLKEWQKHQNVKNLSRVGIPKEILTDQGSNFQSALVKYLYTDSRTKGVHTSPYHLQVDGLIERMHQTFQKYEGQGPKQLEAFFSLNPTWIWLPFLLLTYREILQTSTRFSLSKLLYGRQPQKRLRRLV